ncbi:thioredoxin [Pseudovibrio sp. SPO723]|uniref:thioredoxin n=1 Tax=Nesiotobacter zosterae TaxID=392721 RepID=UPI0029C117F1|nr:thioredoxin [Pseudovibrio sp. SPO723]MDX5594924.1 thioredoxin [Pseudovibrio sp. SPO723]
MSGSGYSVSGSFGGAMSGGYGGGYDTGAASSGSAPASAAAGDLIKDTTTQTFMQDVMEASMQTPVLVDFWAPWCGPCKQLTPVLESVVTEAGGAVKLVKMNIEEFPEIAGQMGIQSIPAVVAFKQGQPVDAFMGAQPESQIKSFIERLGVKIGPSDTQVMLEQAEAARAAGDVTQAAQAYAGVLSMDSDNVKAIAGLTQCFVAADELDRAKQTLEMTPEDKRDDQDYLAALKAIELAEQAGQVDDLADLRARIEANPADHQARFDYAIGLNARGEKQEAVDQLIEIMRRDREWNEDGARQQLLQFFEAWGFKDPAATYGRRKLSSILFA